MIENLQQAFERNGGLTVMEMALEVAFTGETWREVCDQAEQIGAVEPGLYRRLRAKLGNDRTLNSLVCEALAAINSAS